MFYEYNFDRVENMGNLKAIFNIVFDDCFMVSNCEIRESTSGSLYALMPSVPTDKGASYIKLDVSKKNHILEEILKDYSLNQKKVCHKMPDKLQYTVSVNYIGSDRLKAFVNLSIGFVDISGIRILENKDGNIFVSMPGYKTDQVNKEGKAVFNYVANPVTKDFYNELNKNILSIYDNVCAKSEPDEINLLQKTIVEYTEMINNIYQEEIPQHISEFRTGNGDNLEYSCMCLAENIIAAYSMRESISVARDRIQELRSQLRRKGFIDEDYEKYDKLFEKIGNNEAPLSPSQKEAMLKSVNKSM